MATTENGSDRRTRARLARAAILLGVSGTYLSYVFQLSGTGFWTSGVGDWMDPHFINALLEHWYGAALTLGDPSSPPMYFPVRGTLGYSHGLVLYVPFYLPLRLFVHPFLAYNLTLLLVLWTGIVCLYVALQKLGLTFVESLVLTAFFSSSKNVINGGTGTWSQRASVFLIPPILLLMLVSWRRRHTRGAVAAALVAGFLSGLMYVQDFYTAHFAFTLAILILVPVMLAHQRVVIETIRTLIRQSSRRATLALGISVLAAAWTSVLLVSGGISTEVFGIPIRSRAWQRPMLIAVVSGIAGLWLQRTKLSELRSTPQRRWFFAFAAGAMLAAVAFLWIYLPAYRQHRSFPDQQLIDSLVQRDPRQWSSALDIVRDLNAYDTRRSFVLVFTIGTLVWLPWFGIDRRVRLQALWFLAVSLMVLLIPLGFDGFSIWRTLVEPLPGFAVIRDPKRVIYLFELAVVILGAALLIRLPRTSVLRLSVSALALFLLLTSWNRETFSTARPIESHEQWAGASIRVDRSCESFFVKAGPADYSSRSDNKWTLYSIDAIFVSLNHSLPTLNGYSAWFPDGWDLFNPEEAEYQGRVRHWIERHQLGNVCELDIEKRTIRPVAF